MTDRLEELRAALELVQWGSCDACGRLNYCPVCHEPRTRPGDECEEVPGQHLDKCPVGRALEGTR